MKDICIRAGSRVYDMIQDGEFDLDRITAFAGPATGPRWLVASGFDRGLLEHDILARSHPVLLAGASAGALRFAAWVQPDPLTQYDRLIDAYIAMHVTAQDTPETIREAVRMVIDAYVEDDALSFALTNKRYRLAIVAARARHCAAFDMALIQKPVIAGAFLANLCSHAWLYAFFRRIVFHSGPIRPRFCFSPGFRGEAYPLEEANFRYALLASSAIPLAVAGVRNIYGAPNGTYRDGCLVDYHLNQRYETTDDDVTLVFNHDRRLVPVWFDKWLRYRRLPEEVTRHVLLVHPSDEFIESLPGGRVPERKDFKTCVANPAERQAAWKTVVEKSRHLGERFIEAVESGAVKKHVAKIA